MTIPLLATKLYMPPLRPDLVPRLRLIGRLDEGRVDPPLPLARLRAFVKPAGENVVVSHAESPDS